LDALSVQTALEGSRRIVWMIIGMIKRIRQTIGWPASTPLGAAVACWLAKATAPRPGVVLLALDQIRGNLTVGTDDRWLEDPTHLARSH